METKVYVDVLLVLNYVINMLLILCTGRLTGRKPKRRRIVAAALFGSASALTIFLPFLGFAVEFLLKLVLAAAIVLIAFSYIDARSFFKQLFVFFAVSFFFSGVMLALWLALRPGGMIYYNGIVYFDISTLTLIVTSVAAYGALTLFNHFSRGGRLRTAIYEADIALGGRTVTVRGLLDTGNNLYDPFSDTPVVVCRLDEMEPLLPKGAADAIRRGEHLTHGLTDYGLIVRLIPFSAVGGGGTIPAFRPDGLTLRGEGRTYRVEQVYVGLSTQKIGGTGYSAILNPDLIGVKI